MREGQRGGSRSVRDVPDSAKLRPGIKNLSAFFQKRAIDMQTAVKFKRSLTSLSRYEVMPGLGRLR